ncbi:MAG: HD domain-containing protein [Chloroflexi bacterium]|nr:HD domain-containing protein [Chloroflexota bacterium]
MTLVTLDELKPNSQVQAYIRAADDQLSVIGYTEHGFRHAGLVAHIAQNVLLRLGFPERMAQLAAIAGYLHDLGNLVNRHDHATAGALLAIQILREMDMPLPEVAVVAGAIGNHEERIGEPVSPAAAALIIADKSDVHRSRVRNPDPATFDIHDRVNYASQRSFVRVDHETRQVNLEITTDTNIATLTDYFEIFLSRMLFIKRASAFLKAEFHLEINRTKLI